MCPRRPAPATHRAPAWREPRAARHSERARPHWRRRHSIQWGPAAAVRDSPSPLRRGCRAGRLVLRERDCRKEAKRLPEQTHFDTYFPETLLTQTSLDNSSKLKSSCVGAATRWRPLEPRVGCPLLQAGDAPEHAASGGRPRSRPRAPFWPCAVPGPAFCPSPDGVSSAGQHLGKPFPGAAAQRALGAGHGRDCLLA